MAINLITRKGNKLQLNGNVISGDTFAVKDYLKAYCGARNWDKLNKTWTVDLDQLNHILSIGNSIGLRVDDSEPQVETKSTYYTKLCPLCHTYCDGDCTAH